MKTIFLSLFLVASMAGAAVTAGDKNAPASKEKIDSLVKEYLLEKQVKKQKQKAALNVLSLAQGKALNMMMRPPNCDDGPPGGGQGCLDAVCGQMPSYNCDDSSEISNVLDMCRGVDGDCVTAMCDKMPSYNCDDTSELKTVTQSCKGVYDGDCIEVVCSKMPSYNCDDLSEVQRVGRMCNGRVTGSCIESVCSKMPSYNCDDLSELERIAQSCKGN